MVMNPKKILKEAKNLLLFVVLPASMFFIFFLFLHTKETSHTTVVIDTKYEALETKIVSLEKDKQYTKQASTLLDYYYRKNICMRFHTIKELLKAIDKYLPHYFPEGPFTRDDFIAIALTETTNLDQFTIGGFGERGIFQIMPNMCKAGGVKKNYFNIFVNTELAMFVLNEKFKKHNDYYKTIIAYNGVIVDPNTKKWRDKYWKRFLKYRRDVSIIFGGN